MTLKRKVNLFFAFLFLFFVSFRAEENIYPLEIDVIFSPCPCGDRIYIFSKNGRNQTLSTEDNAPNCNLFPLNPIVQPVCFQNKTFVADKDGTFYFLSDEGTKPVGKFNKKIVAIHTFNEKLYIVYERSLKEFDGEEIELPFDVVSSFCSVKGIFLFGEKEFAFYDKENNLTKITFSTDDVKGAVSLKDNFVVCGKDGVFFVNKKGKVVRKFLLKYEIVSIVPVQEDKVAVASTDHFVRLFDKKGNVIWQYRVEGAPSNLCVSKKGILVAAINGSSLVLLEPRKGAEIWSYKTKEGEIHSLSLNNSQAIFYSLKDNLEWVLNIVEIPQ
ncbi:MAG: PQQ-binding-like beta-propeller repeat protein [Thermoanaerobaculaceae bacterium]|nr:PQQ-binding-like beta-propeller repeat protein [Thermoanaerobaculaceae bacterium]